MARPTTSLTVPERRQIVGFYRDAMERISRSIGRHTLRPKQVPRFAALLSETERALKELDGKAARWARQKVSKIYNGNMQWTEGKLRVLGVNTRAVAREAQFLSLHERVVRDLLLNPETGISPRLLELSRRMRMGIREYIRRHRSLLRQVRAINGTIAEGVLESRTAGETRDAVLSALEGTKPRDVLGLERDVSATGPYQSFIDAPYVVIPTARGARRVHIFDHVQQMVQTTESRARTLARNNRALQSGIDHVQITPNAPLTPDVCSIYAGRVFALTEEAASRSGLPLYARLPNGGAPFHPNCTHSTIPFVVPEGDLGEVGNTGDTGVRTVAGGVPLASLDRDFSQAQRWFKERGGIKFAAKQNPQLRKAKISRFASAEVTEALK